MKTHVRFVFAMLLWSGTQMIASAPEDTDVFLVPLPPHKTTPSVASQMGVKYVPPKEQERVINTDQTELVMPDIVLPKMMVNESRIRLSERDALSAKGRLEVAQQRYLTPLYKITFGPLSQIAGYYFNWLSILHGWHPNEAEAMTLYREDDRRRILTEMDSLIRLESIDNTKDADELKRMRFEIRKAGVNGLYW